MNENYFLKTFVEKKPKPLLFVTLSEYKHIFKIKLKIKQLNQ